MSPNPASLPLTIPEIAGDISITLAAPFNAAVTVITREGIKAFREILEDPASVYDFCFNESYKISEIFLQRLKNSGWEGRVLAEKAVAQKDEIDEHHTKWIRAHADAMNNNIPLRAPFDAAVTILPLSALRTFLSVIDDAPSLRVFLADDSIKALHFMHCLINTGWEGRVLAERVLKTDGALEFLMTDLGRKKVEHLVSRLDPIARPPFEQRILHTTGALLDKVSPPFPPVVRAIPALT